MHVFAILASSCKTAPMSCPILSALPVAEPYNTAWDAFCKSFESFRRNLQFQRSQLTVDLFLAHFPSSLSAYKVTRLCNLSRRIERRTEARCEGQKEEFCFLSSLLWWSVLVFPSFVSRRSLLI